MDATPYPTPTQSGATEKEQNKFSQDPRFSESSFKPPPPQYLHVDGGLPTGVCMRAQAHVGVGGAGGVKQINIVRKKWKYTHGRKLREANRKRTKV